MDVAIEAKVDVSAGWLKRISFICGHITMVIILLLATGMIQRKWFKSSHRYHNTDNIVYRV